MDEPASDSILFYDDEGECKDCDQQIHDYDEDYEDLPGENVTELYQYCLTPSVKGAVEYFFPLLVCSILFRILTQYLHDSPRAFHGLSIAIGLYIVKHYVPECLYLVVSFAVVSYICISLPRDYRGGMKTFVPSLSIILYCEYSMDPVDWHKVRGVVMIAAMKAVSLATDKSQLDRPGILEYFGYMFGGVTSLFGPWISFNDYLALQRQRKQWDFWWIFTAGRYLLVSFFFLSISNCWTHWMLSGQAGKWFLAYRDALAFRTSHYFVSFASSSILLLVGYPQALASIAKPLEIELPRSLVQVVVSWNIPMHTWLKLYIFRPARRRLGKFSAVVVTYLASSLLHGLNFQLAAVLLSLGFYTFVEYQLRNVLTETFDACIAAKKCPEGGCPHAKKSSNCWWVVATNLGFSGLTIFHLAYLGLMFDTSEIQETGYSYEHTIAKWSQLGFASHWVAFATYVIYFLIR